MISKDSNFIFTPPATLSQARRVLVKPCAGYPVSYPVSTSPRILRIIIEGIRKVSDADILIADGNPTGESIYPNYRALEYDFRRVLMLDIRDSIFVEVGNPLTNFFAVDSFWIPNVVLRSDFLISVTPFRICGRSPLLTIANLLGLLPVNKYRKGGSTGRGALYDLGIERVFADLYFTMPFDVGIIEASKQFSYDDDPLKGREEEYGKVFWGDPYVVDKEASQASGFASEYLRLIDEGREQLEE